MMRFNFYLFIIYPPCVIANKLSALQCNGSWQLAHENFASDWWLYSRCVNQGAFRRKIPWGKLTLFTAQTKYNVAFAFDKTSVADPDPDPDPPGSEIFA